MLRGRRSPLSKGRWPCITLSHYHELPNINLSGPEPLLGVLPCLCFGFVDCLSLRLHLPLFAISSFTSRPSLVRAS